MGVSGIAPPAYRPVLRVAGTNESEGSGSPPNGGEG
jgi:hypothetical protein